jgi:hypothetical protein
MIIIIRLVKHWACFLFLDPQNEIGFSISSDLLCSFVLLVYIVTLVLVTYLCPSSVHVVATFTGTVFLILCNLIYYIFGGNKYTRLEAAFHFSEKAFSAGMQFIRYVDEKHLKAAKTSLN